MKWILNRKAILCLGFTQKNNFMKKYFLVLIFLSSYSFSQDNELILLRNLAVNLNLQRLQQKYTDELLKDNETENRKRYLADFKYKIENLYLLDEHNNSIFLDGGKFKTIAINSKENRDLLSKGIDVWKIFTSIKGNKMTIGIVDFIVSYESDKLVFGNRESSVFVFEYSCELAKWILISSDIKGR